jgi:hypothetical protein
MPLVNVQDIDAIHRGYLAIAICVTASSHLKRRHEPSFFEVEPVDEGACAPDKCVA